VSEYDAIWQAFDEITARFSEEERRKLFHANPAHFL
jgi:predicted TIM-barrel fold metal-dependent hydrolase